MIALDSKKIMSMFFSLHNQLWSVENVLKYSRSEKKLRQSKKNATSYLFIYFSNSLYNFLPKFC